MIHNAKALISLILVCSTSGDRSLGENSWRRSSKKLVVDILDSGIARHVKKGLVNDSVFDSAYAGFIPKDLNRMAAQKGMFKDTRNISSVELQRTLHSGSALIGLKPMETFGGALRKNNSDAKKEGADKHFATDDPYANLPLIDVKRMAMERGPAKGVFFKDIKGKTAEQLKDMLRSWDAAPDGEQNKTDVAPTPRPNLLLKSGKAKLKRLLAKVGREKQRTGKKENNDFIANYIKQASQSARVDPTGWQESLLACGQMVFIFVVLAVMAAVMWSVIYYVDQINVPTSATASVHEKVANFSAVREGKKLLEFLRVWHLGLSFMIVGDLLIIVTDQCIILPKSSDRLISRDAQVKLPFLPELPLNLLIPSMPLGFAMRMSGLLLISTIPTTFLDFDKLHEQRPFTTLVLVVTQTVQFIGNVYYQEAQEDLPGLNRLRDQIKYRASVYAKFDPKAAQNSSEVVHHPYLEHMFPREANAFFPTVACFLLLICFTINSFCGTDAFTTVYSLAHIAWTFGRAWYSIMLPMSVKECAGWWFAFGEDKLCPKNYRHNAMYRTPAILIVTTGCITCLATVCFVWDWMKQRRLHHDAKSGRHPTQNMYFTIYSTYFIRGAALLFMAVIIHFQVDEKDWHIAMRKTDSIESNRLWGLQRMYEGFYAMLIPFLFFIMGRESVFNYLGKSFEKDEAENDGAFMAELLDGSTHIEVGTTWWIHHGGDQFSSWNRIRQQHRRADLDRFDPRHNFHAGVISRVEEEYFEVEVRHHATQVLATKRFDRPHAGVSASELLLFAHKNLRCIDWKDLTFELMSGQTVGGRVGGDYSLSRPLNEGEHIDFFLSHSWHDDATIKYAKMTETVNTFYEEHQRYPTFWLDKVCIDQSRISDGLKVLPVNVMACSEMLVMWGETYAERLWCAWELCTLFSFMDEEQARARLKLVALGDATDMCALLRAFDVKDAHCYDPNEENRLRTIIAEVGDQRFNESIRKIGSEPNPT